MQQHPAVQEFNVTYVGGSLERNPDDQGDFRHPRDSSPGRTFTCSAWLRVQRSANSVGYRRRGVDNLVTSIELVFRVFDSEVLRVLVVGTVNDSSIFVGSI
jgi:hypothetical protein